MEEEKKYKKTSRERQKRGDKNKQKESKHKNNETTTTHDNNKKRTHIKDAGEVESNNWAVKPPQVWSLRSEPSKVTPALGRERKLQQ